MLAGSGPVVRIAARHGTNRLGRVHLSKREWREWTTTFNDSHVIARRAVVS